MYLRGEGKIGNKELCEKSQKAILDALLHAHDGLSRSQLCTKTGLSYKAIRNHLRVLLKNGQVKEEEKTSKLYEKNRYLEKISRDTAETLQKVLLYLRAIDPNAAKYKESEESDTVYREMKEGKHKGKSFPEGLELIEQNSRRVQARYPLSDILVEANQIKIAIDHDAASFDSYCTMIKGDKVYVIPAALLKGLNFLDRLSYTPLTVELMEKIKKKNSEFSSEIMQLAAQLTGITWIEPNKETLFR